MEIKIEKRYLVFPVNTKLQLKSVTFKKEGETVYELNIKLDSIDPDFYAYIDVSRFVGSTLTISAIPEMPISCTAADEMDIPDLYHETFRPQVHFTAKNGWLNDPNGLIYKDGVYHMFFQHNPAENAWQNMHWGHATSPDMIHWTETDIALYPDETGMMFSGGAIEDERNLLGLNEGENKAGLLFYTATAKHEQRMAYSTDGFKTITKYENNPVVPHIAGYNRDPKVMWSDELGCYVMALYLEKDIYCFLKSHDLVTWEETQRISIPGDNECPDLLVLKNEQGDTRWVLIGAHDCYFVGTWVDGVYTPIQPVQTIHFGHSGYAGQSYSGLPGGRCVRVLWDRWNINTPRFTGQMGIPMEMGLKTVDGVEYLTAQPIAELANIYDGEESYENIALEADAPFTAALRDSAYYIELQGGYAPGTKLEVGIFGRSFTVDFAANTMKMGGDKSWPVSVCRHFDLKIIVDRCSFEIFTDEGRIFATFVDPDTVPDRNLPAFTLSADGAYTVDSLKLHPLKSIWE